MLELIPDLLPDELAGGWAGRLCWVNPGVAGNPPALKRDRRLEIPSQPALALEQLIAASKLESAGLLRHHTMLPVLRAVYGKSGPQAQVTALRFAFRLPSGVIRACPHCIERDTGQHLVSYWHRQHHLMGVDWCPEHQVPLLAAPSGALSWLPAHCVDVFSDDFDGDVKNELGHPVLVRLQQIQQRWLAMDQSIQPNIVTRRIGARCDALGLRCGQVGHRPLVSDLALDQLPATWVERNFPGLTSKRSCEYFNPLDGVARDRHIAYPTFAYALALALVYDNVDEALAPWSAVDDEPTNTGAVGEAGKLAELTGRSPTHRDPSAVELASAVELFMAGTSISQVCRLQHLRRCDIELAIRHRLLTSHAISRTHASRAPVREPVAVD